MPVDWNDDDQVASQQEQWEAILAQLPEVYQRHPGRLLEEMRATSEQLDGLRAWHGQYQHWKDTFDWESYEAYLQSRAPAPPMDPEPMPAEPPLVPSPPRPGTDAPPAQETRPAEVEVWSWSDLDDEEPDADEGILTSHARETLAPVTGDVPPSVEETPPIVAHVTEEMSDARNWHADRWWHWIVWRQCVAGISAWLRGK